MDNKPNKKILGSVAVDSQTGMDTYGVPKSGRIIESETGKQIVERPGFRTPDYGEVTDRKNSENLAGVPDEFMNLFEHDPSEVIMLQATRHAVGVIAIFAMAGVAAFLVLAMYMFVISDSSFFNSIGMNADNVGAIGALVMIILMVLIVGVSLLAATVYKKSRLILTNQKVVLIQYHSLIAREVSQLNIGEVEDVNVSQPSIFDRIFKTGRITIETSGEQNNYVLTQVEKPFEFAKQTIQMHEGSIAEYGN